MPIIPNCDNCGKELFFTSIAPSLGIYTPERSFILCSYECMQEISWAYREKQPKLSKSTSPQSTDPNTT